MDCVTASSDVKKTIVSKDHFICVLVAALTTVSREPGQALTGAAISGVALCEGCLQHADRECMRLSLLQDSKSRLHLLECEFGFSVLP